MKKYYLFMLGVLTSLSSLAQLKVPGDPQLLVGATLTVQPSGSGPEYGYKDFYKVFTPDIYRDEEKIVPFYDDKHFSSKYDSLVNQSFKCISVKPWPSSVDDPKEDKYVAIELQSTTLGILYFRYDKGIGYGLKQTFKITGSEAYYCSEIQKNVDKFDGTIEYETPISDNITITKKIKGGHTIYFMTLETFGASPLGIAKGATILLKDNTKISRPLADISTRVEHNYIYSTTIALTATDILKLKTIEITDFRLYFHDQSVAADGERYKAYINCLFSKQ